ncbi:MAG TPA: hypothetical protein VGE21_03420 [Flavobacteriales bacterium]
MNLSDTAIELLASLLAWEPELGRRILEELKGSLKEDEPSTHHPLRVVR